MSILIKDGTIVTMNASRDVLKADLLIENGLITAIGKLDNPPAVQIINAGNKLVIPGLIQTHVHLCQTLFRGMADDLELLDWLKLRIWPLEAAHDRESLYHSAILGCAELLRGGTTAIADMPTVNHTNSVFEAVKESGMRYLGGKCMMDNGADVPPALLDTTENALQESMDLYEKWHETHNSRINYAFCPRFALSCSKELLLKISRISAEKNIKIHSHASENRAEVYLIEDLWGMRNINWLNSLGLCSPRLILAHCIHIDKDEMDILAGSGTNITHCPSANLKLASGIAKIPELIEMGCNVALGADGPPCNNNLDAFMEMRLAALIQKPIYGPTSMPAETVFAMATLGGAKALGLENEIGSLEPGKKADVAIVDLDSWHTRPLSEAEVYSQLVYQAKASDVYATIVDGKLLMLEGNLLQFKPDVSEIEKSLTRVKNHINL